MTGAVDTGRGPTVAELLAEELERDADAVELRYLHAQIERAAYMLQLHIDAQRERMDAAGEHAAGMVAGLEDGIRELRWVQQAGAVYRAAWVEQVAAVRGLA
jgi:hypothetical protein